LFVMESRMTRPAGDCWSMEFARNDSGFMQNRRCAHRRGLVTICMVRRTTAREKLRSDRQVCGNVFGLWLENVSPGHDELRCVPVLTSRSVVGETIISIRLKARRCDYSFVFAVPVQTSVGKFKIRLMWGRYWHC
jgi:hypothetical protein